MGDAFTMKVVGKPRDESLETPESRLRRAAALIEEMDRLNPWPRSRGFVKCFKTHDDYEAWKKEQPNPRCW